MKPIFTIHEGEFLVGDFINRKFRRKYDVWVPTKDDGVDLLVTRKDRDAKPVGLQVKFSRSYKMPEEIVRHIRATSWFRIEPAKIRKSAADLWVFVLITLKQEQHFVIVPTKELKRRIPANCGKHWDIYLWVYDGGKCFDMRDLSKNDKLDSVYRGVKEPRRDFSKWLENWDLLRA